MRKLGVPKWWWVGLPLMGLIYVLLAHVVPGLGAATSQPDSIGSAFSEAIGSVSKAIAPWAPFFFLVAWVRLVADATLNSRRLDRQTGIGSIRDLQWREFEDLLFEAYRRRGYRVQKTPGGADGGVDLILQGDDGRILVQAKQWKVRSVGVGKVRELFGVVNAERADSGILVTSGNVTQAGKQFARRNGIQVVEGRELEKLIRSVQPALSRNASTAAPAGDPSCPSCQSPMVRRVARRGPRKGQPFWGCSRYPTCRGIVVFGI